MIFILLLFARLITALLLAWPDSGSLNLPTWLRVAGVLILSPAWIYTAYSVRKYFGFKRAAGADHFHLPIREMPLVRKGIFRFSGNAMYAFGFLLFWTIAIGFDSAGALVVAAFSHAYIWVHYHATEKPDLRFLYSESI
ncbi:MAG: hypothetical protein HQ519_19560 [Planctomycetes bacterium]|nr:hypothetical protein [Planctomycetota bacterium]